MSNKRLVLLVVIVLSALSFSACGRNDNLQDEDNRTIAKINSYNLTVADFKSESGSLQAGDYSEADFERAKAGLLDDLITKKLLIQEAQKQNFDKDKAFIKEIERYWEQALLKLLYNKRSQELLREISMSESDPKIRDKKVQEALNTWIEDLKKRASIKKYEANLRAVKL